MKRTREEEMAILRERIARGATARRPGVYLFRLQGRLERLQEEAKRECAARLAEERQEAGARDAGAKAAEAVSRLIEAALDVLEVAPAVNGEDAADCAEMVSILGSWFPPPASQGGDGEGDGVEMS